MKQKMIIATILLSILPLLAVNVAHANNIWVFAPGNYVGNPTSYPFPVYGSAGLFPLGSGGASAAPATTGLFSINVLTPPGIAWAQFNTGSYHYGTSGMNQAGSVTSGAYANYVISGAPQAGFYAILWVIRYIPSPPPSPPTWDVWINYYHYPASMWQDGPGPLTRTSAIDLEVIPSDKSLNHGSYFMWTPGAYYSAGFIMWTSALPGSQTSLDGWFKHFTWVFLQGSPLEPLTPVNATVSLSPPVGPVGTNVEVNGTGFAPSSPVTVSYDNASVANVMSDVSGNFNSSFLVPSNSTKGLHAVVATDGAGNQAATVFNVYIPSAPLVGDLNGDGKVDIKDIAIVAKQFGKTDPNFMASTGSMGTTLSTQVITYSGISALATIGAVAPTAYVLGRKKNRSKITSEK